MSTKTEPDKDELNPSQADYDKKFNEIAGHPGNADLTAKGDQITAEHRDGQKSSDGLAKKESQAEGKEPLKNTDNNPEKSWYNSSFPGNKSFSGRVINAFKMASTRKKVAFGSGIMAIILSIFAFFSFLTTFQLVHLAEWLGNIMDAQSERVLNRRARLHYKIVFNEDGKGYYQKTGVRGRLAKGYAAFDPQKLVTDLRSKGYDLSVDRTGKVYLNGSLMEGKVSDARNRVSEILDAEYPQDGFIKRHWRSKTAFRAMGIQRVFFFENTRRRFATWELEMISRLRQRLGFSDANARLKVSNDAYPEGSVETDPSNTAQLIDDLQDPSYDPGSRVELQPPDVSDIDASKINLADAAKGSVSVTGWIDAACEIKYVLKGTELLASVIRHQALVRNAGALLVAAHQMKTGENVDVGQISGLMAAFNRKPGIGASGSYQLLNGDPEGAKSVNVDKYGLKFTSGYGGFLSSVNERADAVLDKTGVGPGYCRVSRNLVYQIVTGVAGVALIIGGTATGAGIPAIVGKTAVQAAFWGLVGVVANYVSNLVAFDLAGPGAILNYGESQGGDDSMDALAGGVLAVSSGERYQNGMTQRLSSEEIATLENQIALEKNEKLKNESIYNKYLALDNVDSFMSKQLATFPTAQQVGGSAMGSLPNLPINFVKSLSLLTPGGRAKAATATSNDYLTSNPLSIPLYGMTDSTVNEINSDYDPIENENWVYDNGGLEEYKTWVRECFPTDPEKSSILYGLATNEDEENMINTKCTFGTGEAVASATTNITNSSGDEGYTGVAGISDREKYLRYSTYHIDRTIQQAMLFMTGQTECINPDSEDWDCINVDEVDAKDVVVRAGTLNVLGNKHTDPGGKLASWPSGARRINDAFDVIEANGLHIVGLQELEPEQRDELTGILTNKSWSIYPKNADYNNFRSSNSIIWDASEFEAEPIDSGFQMNLEYLGGSRLDVPWVKLRHTATGQVVYVKNTHDPVDKENVQYRINDAKKHLDDAAVRVAAGDKVILLGDFNSDGVVRDAFDGNLKRNNLTYCIVTDGEILQNTYDTSKDIRGHCPTERRFSIDHIYTSTDIKATSWQEIDNLESQEITDHPLIYSDLIIAKLSSSSGSSPEVPNAEGWSWPVAKDTNISSCFNQRIFHPVYKQYMYHPGIDFGGDKLPIYAANAGVVTKAGGDSQNTIIIKHEGGVWSVYEHLSQIDVSVDDIVTSGQQIGLSGNVGYSTGPHLHFGITKDPNDYFYATMGEGKLYNPLVFINSNQSYKQCSIDPRIK